MRNVPEGKAPSREGGDKQAVTQQDRIERMLTLVQVDLKETKAMVEAMAKQLGLSKS